MIPPNNVWWLSWFPPPPPPMSLFSKLIWVLPPLNPSKVFSDPLFWVLSYNWTPPSVLLQIKWSPLKSSAPSTPGDKWWPVPKDALENNKGLSSFYGISWSFRPWILVRHISTLFKRGNVRVFSMIFLFPLKLPIGERKISTKLQT